MLTCPLTFLVFQKALGVTFDCRWVRWSHLRSLVVISFQKLNLLYPNPTQIYMWISNCYENNQKHTLYCMDCCILATRRLSKTLTDTLYSIPTLKQFIMVLYRSRGHRPRWLFVLIQNRGHLGHRPKWLLDLYNIALCCTRTMMISSSVIQCVGSRMLLSSVFLSRWT